MIRLTKGDEPDVLVRNGQTWTQELLHALANGQDISAARKNRYNNAAIKAALLKETAEKCAYCESKFRHVTFGDIEHITPKDTSPEMTYEWNNLTIACDLCNTNKGARVGFIDPYADDPSTHFKFRGPMICAIPTDEVAKMTVLVLDLNRTPLLERRKEKIDELNSRLAEILTSHDANVRRILAQALIDYARDNAQQYSACAAEHVVQLKADGHLPADLQ
jgi:uncharacterized protein (TIGR02646 family)